MAKWARHSLDFKRRAVAQMAKCESVKALAKELKVDRSLLYTWKAQLEGRPKSGRADLSQTEGSAREKALWEENRLLKETLGVRSLEIDFFADALRRIEEQRQQNTIVGGTVSTRPSGRGTKKRKAN